MAAIEKRIRNGKTSYRVRYRDPIHTQRSKSFPRKVDAERFGRTVEVEKDAGTWIDPKAGRTTLAEWRTRFVVTELGNRASTRARDESYWRNHMGPILGPRPLASIDYATVQGWVGDLSARVSPATVAKAYGILSKTLNGAVKAGLIPANRAEGVELPRIEREEQQFLTVGEIDRLADAIDPQYRTLVLVGAYGGLRRGELFALRRSRVDLMARHLDIVETAIEVSGHHSFGPPKSKAGHRRVPLPRRVIDELIPELVRLGPDDLAWTSSEGHPLRSNFRSRVWIPAIRRAGLDNLRMHDLRHTAVSLWIAAGANPKEIATWAGHSSVSTILDIYGHLLPGSEEPVMDALDRMQSRPEGEVIELRR